MGIIASTQYYLHNNGGYVSDTSNQVLALIIGKIPVRANEDTIEFSDGTRIRFFHEQDCCENVYPQDVNGDWTDLIGVPLLVAEQRDCDDGPLDNHGDDCYEWTFYTFRSINGSVDVRWYGESNGYYSTSVDMTLETVGDN